MNVSNVDNVTLFWLMFYIAIILLGIFMTLTYIATKEPRKKSR